jgi:ribonuclease T
MSNNPELFISVDIEASGPVPGLYSMLSIGACHIYNPEQTFECFLKPTGKFVDEEAVKVTGLDLDFLKEVGLDPIVAMKQFRDWVTKASGANAKPIFVGLNAGFDWSFINYYFYDAKVENPFGFAPLDIKSMYFAVTNNQWSQSKSSVMIKDLQPKSYTNHNALADAIAQAELFRLIIDKYKKA